MFKIIAKFFAPLNGNQKRTQVAAGFSWGLLLGLIPAGNVFWIVLFAVSFLFRNNHLTKILFMIIVKLFLGLLNPQIDIVGWELLHIEALQPFFITLYNMPLVPLTAFNNTLVAGGLCLGLILWIPAFFLFLLFIPLYRNVLIPKIRNSKLFKKSIAPGSIEHETDQAIISPDNKEEDGVSVICTDLENIETKQPEALDDNELVDQKS
jgi:uncharacterized protein (TIGR03546 family)